MSAYHVPKTLVVPDGCDLRVWRRGIPWQVWATGGGGLAVARSMAPIDAGDRLNLIYPAVQAAAALAFCDELRATGFREVVAIPEAEGGVA